MNLPTNLYLRMAESALLRGDIREAQRLVDDLIASGENSAELWFLAGSLKARQGDPANAERLLAAALEHCPRFSEAHLALSNVLKVRDPDMAVFHAMTAAEIAENDFEIWFHAGIVAVDARRFHEAATAFESAYRLSPQNPNILRNLAMALRDSGRELEAIEVLQRLVALVPNHIPALLNLGQLSLAHGQFDRAKDIADAVLRRSKKDASGHLLKALALAELGKGAEAEPYLAEAVRLNPKDGIARASMGFWLQEQGRFSEAQSNLERAIDLNPEHGFAYMNLVRAKRMSEDDRPFLERMLELANKPDLHPRDRSYFFYALGKSEEDLGNFEASISHIDRANALAYEVWLARDPWDRESYAAGLARTREVFSRDRIDRMRQDANQSETPILIVGMIRSGTSLLEQMLSSHPDVSGAGELPFWHENEKESILGDGSPNVDAFPGLAKRYLDRLREVGGNAKRVTDKLPHNYAMLGQIHASLPAAKILHVRRNPLDNCLSVYTTPYQRPPVFAHSRENIVFAYREYLRLMEHWRTVIPSENLLELDYEEMVTDRESALRRALEFCGLAWSDSCLRHESNRRSVRTPSLWQVRQPIYTSSLGRWQRFAPWISDMREGLR